MQDHDNLLPIESDVKQYLDKELSMFDTHIADVFKELKLASLLKSCSINKRTGHSVDRIIFDLFMVPFLLMSTVFLFVQSQYEQASAEKNRFYRFLGNANYNWRLFLFYISYEIHKKIKPEMGKESFFVIDDTITTVTGKLVESASYIYDHVTSKTVLGFQKLVLGLFDGSHFIPISSRICVGKTKPVAKSKAKKYNKIPKVQRIDPKSPGAIEREDMDDTKLTKTISMLKAAKRKGFSAETVLFDSWYCFNSFIIKLEELLNLRVICQLKNMPRTNKYIYQGKSYSLKELFAYYGKNKLRMVKKYQLKRSCLTVSLPNSKVKMKIVFVFSDGEKKWHAFASTNIQLSAWKILEYYSQRWSIEVFFKNCKQYLNYGKEQMSNLDSIIACDALVFLRYMILTYLAYLDQSTFYEKFSALRKKHSANIFGVRLLKFFLNKLQFLIEEVRRYITNDQKEKAFNLLDYIAKYNVNIDPVPLF